ncbi:MarR family winged helix-turn-helix transcriptional regulator [Actinomycetospora atypica]|uniref:MarR family winged helix-turn-helix transcriptional regulator n=1 Tax=Actinomycetospora atypica TaxID=1290095 RepID=A0ABV9YPD6_9PSEU
MDDEVAAHRNRLLTGLRSFGARYAEITRRFADHLGLHATDATALTEILTAEDSGTPITPARLARRLGLTSGATTILLNRLEAAGYVVRSREHTDRRVVSLRSGPGTNERAYAFFAPLAEALDAMLDPHPRPQLEHTEALLDELDTTLAGLLDEGRLG